MSSNLRSLAFIVLTLICISKAYTIDSVSTANALTSTLTSVNSPSLAGGSDFFVTSQLDASNNLFLAFYDLSTSPTANSGSLQSPRLATATWARVAANGDYVGVAYVNSNYVYFVLLLRSGSSSSAFTKIAETPVGAGTQPWVASHPNGWIVLYKNSNSGIALASLNSTQGNVLKTAIPETGSCDLPSLGTSTGNSFVFSYDKAESLTNNLRVTVASMASDGTFTTPASINLQIGSLGYAVPSRAAIAPNGVVLVSYMKPNNYYTYQTITSGTLSGETVLQSSTTANAQVISLNSNLFVTLWEASNVIKGAVIPSDGSASTEFPVVSSGATYPAIASLGPYRFITGWSNTASPARSVTQHYAIEYCGDGFVTKNETCDSGPYCQADCTCPSGQGPMGTGCSAPGEPYSPPVSPPSASPVDQAPTSDTPVDAGVPNNAPDSSQPGSIPLDSMTPTVDLSQAPVDPLDQMIDTLPLRHFIVVIIVPVVGTALALALLIVLLQRRKRRKNKSGPFQGGDDDGGPTQYDQIYVNSSTLDSEPMDLSRFTVDERLHIKYAELKFLKEIGAGAFGKVFIGEWQKTKVALKLNMMAQGTEFEKEARLMVTMRPHPNVVQLYGISTDGPNPVMIIEFCEGGSLDTKLYKARVNLAFKSQLQLISGIAKGLLHLHRNKIVHRDLAARNILLAHGKPKISDFGMSRQLEGLSKAGQTKTTVGPVRWMAPESLSDLSYSPQSDVWSFGCVIYEIIAQQEPHANTDVLTIGIKIRDTGYTPQLPKRVDPFIKKLLKNIWQKDPTKRPTMEQLATTIDEHLAKVEKDMEDDSSNTPSPIEASALDKSTHDEPQNNIGQSSEYDNIKENIAGPGKVSKKGNKSPRKQLRGNKKQAKHEKPVSQQKMLQSDDVYEEINAVNMQPMKEVDNASDSSSSSLEKSRSTQAPKVPPRGKPNTPQRSLPPVPPRTSQNYADDAYDQLPK
eukprot:TRINITY_DN1136_c0_g1_i1.p1 TRINITY_DN1136_c0_g1~~TRINITY_DN1136_c0_g1_i1.p1  ORF type:complete len:969 (-),score=158.75 TRINITY_DN1136_c0_g1_i1:37-2943(-)